MSADSRMQIKYAIAHPVRNASPMSSACLSSGGQATAVDQTAILEARHSAITTA